MIQTRAPAIFLTTAIVAAASGARADSGAPAVDLGAGVLRVGGESIPIALDRASLPDARDVVVEPVAIGDGKTVMHVRVPARGKSGAPRYLAWEAILAPGKPPLFADRTGFSGGDEGEATGKELLFLPADGGARYVVSGELREDVRICGQATTLLDTRVLVPKTLEWKRAAVQQLPQEQRVAATRLVAMRVDHREKPLAPLLVATGASQGNAAALTDGDPSTAWTEERTGNGGGELVVMRAPEQVPIASLTFTIAPPQPSLDGASPRTFYVVTDSKTFEVHVQEDAWAHPGASYEVRFAEALRTSCVSVVLDEAYADRKPHPEVTFAEIGARSTFDAPGATLVSVAKELGGEADRANAAAAILARAGGAALDAIATAYDALDASGRQRAMDVAVGAPCANASALLARGLVDPNGEVSRKARERLERCGTRATEGLVHALGDAKLRAKVAPIVAALAPDDALEPLAASLGDGDRETRAIVRSAFALAARAAPREKLAAVVSDGTRSADARLDALRALGPRVAEVRAECDAALDALLAAASPFRTRYLALGPIAELARAGDDVDRARLERALADTEWPLRMRAAELANGVMTLRPALERAVRDAEPRVRDAALRALAATAPAPAIAQDRALHDPWSFVRVSAIEALARAPRSRELDATLRSKLKDDSPTVRVAAIDALGARRATMAAPPLRAILEDDEAPAAERAASARAVAAMCDEAAVELLTKLARRALAPRDADESIVAAAAIDALGALHPADLAARLEPLSSAPSNTGGSAKSAAARALGAAPACREARRASTPGQ